MQIFSFVPDGYKGCLISVEVYIRRGGPALIIKGLSDAAVRKNGERIKSALLQSGFDFPDGRILIGVSPADTGRAEDSLDLSLAVAVLSSSNQIQPDQNDQWLILGGLDSSGRLKPAAGTIAAVSSAVKEGIRNILVPVENVEEAVSAGAGRVVFLHHLKELNGSLAEQKYDPPAVLLALKNKPFTGGYPDLRDLKGQAHLKRALVVAAAGGHHMLLFGPSCSERTLCASLLEGLLPDLLPYDSHEVSRIWSLAGKSAVAKGLMVRPPFCRPLHTASRESLFGGGQRLTPGEISLAHGGVLFLDDVDKFKGPILQSLRIPLDHGQVTVERAGLSCRYPSRFQLLMAVRPCPCGKLGHPQELCECSTGDIIRHWEKNGRPLIDRTDLRIPFEPVCTGILQTESYESSADLRERIAAAVQRQSCRYNIRSFSLNRDIPAGLIHGYCSLNPFLKDYLESINRRIGLTSPAGQSILKLSRTIADLDDRNEIRQEDLEEAVQYRRYGDHDFFWNTGKTMPKRGVIPD